MEEDKIGKSEWEPTKKEIILMSVISILFIGQIVLCFLFYNWADLSVLVYIGWIILAIGSLFGAMARCAFEDKGGASNKKDWIKTKVVVDSGIYGVVRHPMYLCFIFLVMALIFFTQHWLSAIFGIPIIVYLYNSMLVEEKSSIKKFGDNYKRYMRKVPRANFLLGIIRLLRGRKNENER